MEKIKFYYFSHEYETSIIMIDEDKMEAYSINQLNLKLINKIDYPSKKDLNILIKRSVKEMYDGSWVGIKFILDDPEIVENLAKSKDRDEYITSLKKNQIEPEEKSNEFLIERLWERFGGISSDNAIRYTGLYYEMVGYLKSLTNENSVNFEKITNKFSNKKYISYIFNKTKESDGECSIVRSDHGSILLKELFRYNRH